MGGLKPEFVTALDSCSVGGVQCVLRDADEWEAYTKVKVDSVLHIELRKWADILLVAPSSANTLGKLAHGMCDDLLSCVFRAWDTSRPCIICPAMNTLMWKHPFTARDLDTLETLPNLSVVIPASKELACGDIGTGALATLEDIVAAVVAGRPLAHDVGSGMQ